MKFYDISIPIEEGMIVYPDNPEPQIRRYASIPLNKTNESLISIGSHTGSHVDSKSHIQNGAEGAASLSIDSFYGKCRVLDLTHVKAEIHQKDLEKYFL